MKMTIKELAEKHGVALHDAGGFVGFLEAKGIATKTEESRPVTDADGKPKKGRPSVLYDIPEIVTVDLSD